VLALNRTKQLASTSVIMSIMNAYSALQTSCGDTYLCCFAGKLSKSADVYAFGVLLWEMYTGQRPWSGLGQMQVIFHLTQRKKRLQFPSDTPPQLQVVPLLLLLVLYLLCCCLFLTIFCCLFFFLSSTSSSAASSSPLLLPLLLLLVLYLFCCCLFLPLAAAAAAAASVPWSFCYQCKLAEVTSVGACCQSLCKLGFCVRLLGAILEGLYEVGMHSFWRGY